MSGSAADLVGQTLAALRRPSARAIGGDHGAFPCYRAVHHASAAVRGLEPGNSATSDASTFGA